VNPREINLRSIEYKDDIAEDNHGGESDEVFVMENLNSALLRDPRRGKDLRDGGQMVCRGKRYRRKLERR